MGDLQFGISVNIQICCHGSNLKTNCDLVECLFLYALNSYVYVALRLDWFVVLLLLSILLGEGPWFGFIAPTHTVVLR